VALEGAKRLSFTTSGRSQAYALTLLLGILLMAAWVLANPASSDLLRPLR
jgi:NAD(P)H-quinone oxidoreductase subunit 5